MPNTNTYDITECQTYCKQLPFFDQLAQDFDILRWDKLWSPVENTITPREIYGKKRLYPEKTVFSLVPFFYLKPLLEQNPKTIYDLGAGWNIFKKYIPNIIGVSPTHNLDQYSDVHDYVDQDYVQNHQDYFESVFSINALHFRPLTDLKTIVQEFASMIAPGGKGFLALNLARLLGATHKDILFNIFNTNNPTAKQYEEYTHKVLADTGLEYLILDVDFTVIDEPMDGNIRLVIKK